MYGNHAFAKSTAASYVAATSIPSLLSLVQLHPSSLSRYSPPPLHCLPRMNTLYSQHSQLSQRCPSFVPTVWLP